MLFKTIWSDLRSSLDTVQADLAKNLANLPSENICQYLILAEDHRFYRHLGFDLLALCRACYKTVVCRQRQGGSTIAMQLVRTLSGRYEKTLFRKLSEIVLAVRLTRHVHKSRIPLIYIWVAYYGAGMNNYIEACRRLGLKPNSLSDLEAASLVARLKYPEPKAHNTQRALQIQLRTFHLLRLQLKVDHHFESKVHNGTISNRNVDGWAH